MQQPKAAAKMEERNRLMIGSDAKIPYFASCFIVFFKKELHKIGKRSLV